MSILDMDLHGAVQSEVEQMRTADRVPLSKNEARTAIVDNFYGRATAREFEFHADEPDYKVGGENRGPRPLEYFLAGFNFCQQAIYAENALKEGVELTNLSIEVSGDIDPRGTLGIGGVSPGFTDDTVEYTTHIESPEDPETIREFVHRAEQYCPAHASLRNPMGFEREVVLNGDPLEL